MGVPVVMLLVASIRGPAGSLPYEAGTYFTLDSYRRAVTQRNLWGLASDTTFYVLGATLVGLALGTAAAWTVERIAIPLRHVVAALVVLPFLIPPSSFIRSWLNLVFPRTGELNLWLRQFFTGLDSGPIDPFSIPFMAVMQGIMNVPLTFVIVAAALRNANRGLEEASAASGAAGWTTWRRIVLPTLLPAFMVAAVLSVWLTLDSTDVPSILGTWARADLLTIRISQTSNFFVGGPSLGAAYAVLTAVLILGLFTFYWWGTRRERAFQTVTAQWTPPRRRRPGVGGVLLMLLTAAYFAAWAIPTVTILQGSLRSGLSAYQFVLTSSVFWGAAQNTLLTAGVSATIGTLAVLFIAHVARTSRGFASRGLQGLMTIPLVIPVALAGLAYLLFFLVFDGLRLYGTVAGLTLALSYRLAIPFRITEVGLRQLGHELQEASATSGATPMEGLRHVVLPLIAPAVAMSWAIMFVFGVREATLARYIAYNLPTLSNFSLSGGPPGARSAATVLTFVLVLAVLGVVYRLMERARRGA